MDWTPRDERLISSFVRLIEAGKMTIENVEINYPEYVEEVRGRLDNDN